MYVCIYIYIYVCMCIYIYIYLSISLSLYIYIHTHNLVIGGSPLRRCASGSPASRERESPLALCWDDTPGEQACDLALQGQFSAADVPPLPCPWAVGRSEAGTPEWCEDFVGRAQELLTILRLFGSRSRCLAVLHAPEGTGKSAFCAEFCRVATAPGRRFSSVLTSASCGCQPWSPGLAFVSLKALALARAPGVLAGEQAAEVPDAHSLSVQEALLAAVAQLSADVCRDHGAPTERRASQQEAKVCLVIDHAEEEYGWRDVFASELLTTCPGLCLLLSRRQPLYRLEGGADRWKPVNVELPPLSPPHAARVCLLRVHRPLHEGDFVRGAASRPHTCILYVRIT